VRPLIRRAGGRGAPKPPGIPAPNFDRGWDRCICIASGPSLTHEQVALCAAARPGWRVLVTNNTWERLPDADVLYAGDQSWWEMHVKSVADRFTGECWAGSRLIAHRTGINYIKVRGTPGLSKEPGTVSSGSNSGYQAMGLAVRFGAREIVLVGYDMQLTYGMKHWHGDHPAPLSQDVPVEHWRRCFDSLAADLVVANIRVTNCTGESALECFPRGDLATCLS